jgi:hypothetical protein
MIFQVPTVGVHCSISDFVALVATFVETTFGVVYFGLKPAAAAAIYRDKNTVEVVEANID